MIVSVIGIIIAAIAITIAIRLIVDSRRISLLAQAAYLSASTTPEDWTEYSSGEWHSKNFRVCSWLNTYGKNINRINNYNTKQYETKRIVDFLNNRELGMENQAKLKESQRLMDLALNRAQEKLKEITK